MTTTRWYTFGQNHVHSVNGRTFDKNTVVKITSPRDPRDVMINHFGMRWSMEYDEEPDMKFFKEVVEL